MCLEAQLEVVKLHADMGEYAAEVQAAITARHEAKPSYPLSGGALHSIRADQFGLHRSIMSLCNDGWAYAAIPVLRTMIELMLSTAIIVESRENTEFRGFKYSHQFFKAHINDPAFTEDQRRYFRRQVQEGIDVLPDADRDKGQKFIYSEGLAAYWYVPEYRRPGDAIEKLCPEEVKGLYAMYSSGAHGGYLGLRLHKDTPDDIHPNPRKDRRSQNQALIASIRFLLEVYRACDRFENEAALEARSNEMSKRFYDLQPLVQP